MSEGFYSSVIAVIGSNYFLENRTLLFDNEMLSMLNGINTIWAYGAFSGLSALGLSFAGDFVGMLLKKYSTVNNVSKITRPISSGVVTVGLVWALSGFSMPLSSAVKPFLVGSISNLLGIYLSEMMFPYQARITNEISNFASSMNSSSMSGPSVSAPNPVIDVMPSIGGFGGFGDFSILLF